MAVKDFLTAEEVAYRLNITPSTVRRWVNEGKIPGLYISPKVLRFDWQAVSEALRKRAGAGNAEK